VNSVFNVVYFRGNGDGTFAAPVLLATLTNPLQLVTGDFNGDGKLDFAVYGTDNFGGQTFDFFLGHGDGTFTQKPTQNFPRLSTNFAVPQQIFSGDFNHDGKLDILIGYNGNGGWMSAGDDLVEALGNGDGTVRTPTVLIPHFGAVAVADLNHDGFLDLIQKKDPSEDVGQALFFTPAVTVYLGQANGSFRQQATYLLPGVAVPSFAPALVGDFNGDGNPDIAVPYLVTQYFLLINPRLRVLQGAGDGTFTVSSHSYQLSGVADPFVAGDLDGDHRDDLAELVGLTSSINTIPGADGPSLDIQLNSNPIVGTKGSATVSLNLPATAATTVILSASDPAIQLPGSLLFSPGQQNQTFNFTLGAAFDATHIVAITAKLGAASAVAYASKPNPHAPVGVVADLIQGVYPAPAQISITPGESFALALELGSLDGYTGTFSGFSCSGLPVGVTCTFASNAATVYPGRVARVNFTMAAASNAPFGTYSTPIVATDGFVHASAPFRLGLGDFTLSINPTIPSIASIGLSTPTLSSTATNGLQEGLAVACSGLPAGVTCNTSNTLFNTAGANMPIYLSASNVKVGDYPFQITGSTPAVSHTINATLRVGDFSASLDKTSATLSKGQSTDFLLTVNSLNHYATAITIACQPLSRLVSCSASSNSLTLVDGGSPTVTLTVTAVAGSAAAYAPGATWRSLAFALALMPFGMIYLRSKPRMLCLLSTLSLLLLGACGGGGAGSGTGSTGGGGGAGGPSSAQVMVVLSSQTDLGNQKTLPPIVINLQ
jgi:hypothetical protein